MLKQGNYKNTFCHLSLTPDETYVITPSVDSPRTPKGYHWKLNKTLYDLRRSLGHWYKCIKAELIKMGLTESQHSPCLYSGYLIPNQPPIHIGLYINNFVYYSNNDSVKSYLNTCLYRK